MLDLIAGVDEAGRGALIGDVVSAAVVLAPQFDCTPLKDSKKLTEKQRTELAVHIKADALAWAIGRANAKEIEGLNIHHASLLSMVRAINALKRTPAEVWVDGKFCPDTHLPCKAFVKGDDRFPCISAASILAKTTRDLDMHRLNAAHPGYGFDQHKGYPTKAHLVAIEALGLIEDHRRNYRPIQQYLNQTALLN